MDDERKDLAEKILRMSHGCVYGPSQLSEAVELIVAHENLICAKALREGVANHFRQFILDLINKPAHGKP